MVRDCPNHHREHHRQGADEQPAPGVARQKGRRYEGEGERRRQGDEQRRVILDIDPAQVQWSTSH